MLAEVESLEYLPTDIKGNALTDIKRWRIDHRDAWHWTVLAIPLIIFFDFLTILRGQKNLVGNRELFQETKKDWYSEIIWRR